MADLLKSTKSPLVTFRKGEIVKGTITKLTSSEILVDVNAKTEAVVLEKDKRILKTLLSTLHEGERVDVSILNPESETGNPVVSLRRFIDDLVWRRLSDLQKKQEIIDVTVSETTRGGVLATTVEGISGFLPQSHMLVKQSGEGQEDGVTIGGELKVYVFEVSKPTRKIIFSQKPTMTSQDFDKTIAKLSVGKSVEAVVANVAAFGVFVSIKIDDTVSIDGLIHISEVSWDKVFDLSPHFTPSQLVTAMVIGFDRDAKRVDLSIKRLSQDPFEKIASLYAIDQKVKGVVKEVLQSGVLLSLSGPSGETVEGFIRKEKIPPTVTFKPEDEVNATVVQIDKGKHRIIVVPVLLDKPIGYR